MGLAGQANDRVFGVPLPDPLGVLESIMFTNRKSATTTVTIVQQPTTTIVPLPPTTTDDVPLSETTPAPVTIASTRITTVTVPITSLSSSLVTSPSTTLRTSSLPQATFPPASQTSFPFSPSSSTFIKSTSTSSATVEQSQSPSAQSSTVSLSKNKSAAGGLFGVVGLVVLSLVVGLVLFWIRRQRMKRRYSRTQTGASIEKGFGRLLDSTKGFQPRSLDDAPVNDTDRDMRPVPPVPVHPLDRPASYDERKQFARIIASSQVFPVPPSISSRSRDSHDWSIYPDRQRSSSLGNNSAGDDLRKWERQQEVPSTFRSPIENTLSRYGSAPDPDRVLKVNRPRML